MAVLHLKVYTSNLLRMLRNLLLCSYRRDILQNHGYNIQNMHPKNTSACRRNTNRSNKTYLNVQSYEMFIQEVLLSRHKPHSTYRSSVRFSKTRAVGVTPLRRFIRCDILDLVFTNEEEMIQEIHHEAPVGKSHHSVLSFLFRCYKIADAPVSTRPVYDKGDYEKIRSDLRNINWTKTLRVRDKGTEETWTTIKETLNELTNKHIPQKKTNIGGGNRPGKHG